MVTMSMRTIHACALVALAAVPATAGGILAGCGSDETVPASCLMVCSDSNNCPGATMVDCTSQCASDAELNLASGCTAEFNEEQNCIANLSDPCASTSACSSQLRGFEACVQAFCVQTPTPPECNAD
jgi:hypothetical protein